LDNFLILTYADGLAVKFGLIDAWRRSFKFMSLITVVIVLVAVGFLLWVINTYIPMAGPIKTILNAVVIIAVVLWLLSAFGIIHGLNINLK
jgi:hypothetical protein